jgi:hypothetical protein
MIRKLIVPTCRQAVVTIQSVMVHKSAGQGLIFDTDIGGVPASVSMWRLQFHVAGQRASVCYQEVRDGSVLWVNRSFIVELGPLESLLVECSGVEQEDDTTIGLLPVVTKAFTPPATGWHHGQTFQVAASAPPAISYALVFVIRCAHSMGGPSVLSGGSTCEEKESG